jgi:hypothetical protein
MQEETNCLKRCTMDNFYTKTLLGMLRAGHESLSQNRPDYDVAFVEISSFVFQAAAKNRRPAI